MKASRITVALSTAAALLAGGIALAGPASADPVSGGYVAVGSDTLQDSMNALTNGTSITGATVRVLAGDGTSVGSFDAFGSDSVVVKSAGARFARPSGSGAGLNALSASITGTAYSITGNTTPAAVITGQVDIARSSSGPGTNASTSGKLVYEPYARDAVSYAYDPADAASAAVLANLTLSQLNTIYSAASATTINGVTIYPRLPQSNSGTRKFFTGAIGVSNTTPGAAVPATDNTPSGPAENDATVLGSNQIIPFSVASWIAQSNGAAPNTITGTSVALGTPVTGVTPYTGSGTSLAANASYYSSTTWGRDTYLIVQQARIDPTSSSYDANLANLVDPTVSGSLTSYGTFKTTPGAVKTKYGFLAPSSSTPIRAYATLPY